MKLSQDEENLLIQRIREKPGAWWKTDLTEAMINLRVLRANGDWNEFWEEEAYKSRAA